MKHETDLSERRKTVFRQARGGRVPCAGRRDIWCGQSALGGGSGGHDPPAAHLLRPAGSEGGFDQFRCCLG